MFASFNTFFKSEVKPAEKDALIQTNLKSSEEALTKLKEMVSDHDIIKLVGKIAVETFLANVVASIFFVLMESSIASFFLATKFSSFCTLSTDNGMLETQVCSEYLISSLPVNLLTSSRRSKQATRLMESCQSYHYSILFFQ